jgi:hypothetical protein
MNKIARTRQYPLVIGGIRTVEDLMHPDAI